MAERLEHRGPDAHGFFVKPGIALAHRRLSILDLSEEANLPMTDPSGRYTLVYNGEIYNFRELRKQLKDYPFKTDGDSEVLLAGLSHWGIRFVNECNGMFAFALWDSEAEELYLCRDRMGIKPLYYMRREEEIFFSSEIRSLIVGLGEAPRLNRRALPEFLRYQTVHGPKTILEGVYALPAGSYMRISDNEQDIKTYWSLSNAARTDVRGLSFDDTSALVRHTLESSVQRRLVSDVPLGVFLSGGIDSSALVALASGHGNKPISTFTIDFAEESFSEAAYARQIAEKYSTDHHRVHLQPDELIRQLPLALKAMDHPSGDGINSYVVSGAAKRAGITVALSGLGGDELFAGYPIFSQFHSLQSKKWLLSFPKFVRDIAGMILEKKSPSVASSKTRSVLNQERFDLEYIYQFSREVTPINRSKELLLDYKETAAVYNVVARNVGYGTPGFTLPLLSQVSVAEISTYLENILLRDTDSMSMAHALEVRVPFLDHELVSLILGVSDKYKYPHNPKKLLTSAMGDLIPRSIVDRPKMGFTFPWEIWMKNDLKPFCGDMIDKLAKRDFFNGDLLHHRWDSFLKGDAQVKWSRLWHLVVLEAWLSQNEI
jgi:asparagine synthase (glutamine-hydrolysing)